jgi:hypothetical protein
MEHMPMTSFVSHSNHTCHTAALEQDEIRWQNLRMARYQSFAVSYNWLITMNYTQNDS